MNAKLCKRLRREARWRSVGMPSRRIIAQRQIAYRPDGTLRHAEGAINSPYSTRGIYRALKKAQA